MAQTHLERWSQRFARLGSTCMTLATVDLPQDYWWKLTFTQTLAHWEEILKAPDLDGVRFNLTKGWHLTDANDAIEHAHARGKIVMVDVISRLRILHSTVSAIRIKPGQTIRVYEAADLKAEPGHPHFNRPLDLSGLGVDQPVVIRDGRARGHVVEANEHCVSIHIDWTDHGLLSLHQPPVNFPGWSGSAWTFAPTDRAIIALAVRHRADLLAVSFAEEAAGVETVLRAVLDAAATASVPADAAPVIVLKIETATGLKNLPAMVAALDGYEGGAAIEVARGDLAIEVALERLGLASEYCFQWGKALHVPVGVATGLLGSMQRRRDPSRAEIGDAWAALRAGARFLLLADETANDARYPTEAIATLTRLVQLADGRPNVPWWSPPHTMKGENT